MPKRNKTLAYKSFASFLVVLIALAAMPVKPAYAAACTFTSNATGNWNAPAIWTITGGGCPASGSAGAFPGNTAGNSDTVVISNANTVTLNVTPTRSIASLTLNGGGGAAQLTFNSGASLNVTGNVAVGAGNSASNGIFVNAGALTVGGNLTLTGGASARLATLNISTGVVTITGNMALANGGGGLNLTQVIFTGAGTLNVGGTYTNGGTFTPSTGTVNYTGNAQTIATFATATTYNNLTLSGSGAKTLAGNTTVNGVLSMGGTSTFATGGNTLTYGAASALQYIGTSAQTTGAEFPATFGGTGGVIINNANGVTLGAAKTIANGLTLTSGILATGANNLTLNGAVSCGGGSISATTSTVSYNQGSNGQNVCAGTYFNLTFSNFNKILASSGAIGIAGTFTPGTALGHTVTGSTINFNAAGAQAIPAFTFNNLIFSGSGLKSMIAGTSVGGNLSIAPTGTAKASVGNGLNLTVNSLTLGGLGKTSGTWGSTISPATNKDDNYFNFNNLTTGILTVTTDTRLTQTISFTSIAPASATYGGATYTPAASSTSGLAVTITVDATASSVCSISGGVVSFIGVGNCVLNANQPGNANYNAAPQVQQSFAVGKASQTITASSPSMPYGGPVPTINPIYNPNVVPSTPPTCSTTATVSSPAGTSWPSSCSGAADPNYSISYVDGAVAVVKAGQTITIVTHAPSSAISSATFPVAATASSSLAVAITTTGACSGSGSGSANITMAATVGTCTVHYNQSGDSNYNAAPEKTEDVATLAITSADHATFTVNSAGTFTITTNGAPTPSITETPVSPATLPAWLSFLDNGNGTATLSGTPPTGSSSAYTFTFKASNGTVADATQNFTLTVSGGPVIGANGVNTIPDTGNGHLAEFEVVTVGITKFTVTFNQDVINVPSTDPNYGKSAINPANYLLVNDNGNGFQTVDCKTGLDPQDFAISIDTVTYNNNGGSGPFIATLNINSGLPLSNGNYRLYACGTTSITNLGGLKLAGDGRNEGADFIRNFIVQLPNNGGGGNGGAGYQGGYTVGLPGLIPVTGFAPGRATLLPAQPADSAYSPNTGLRLEIPALGVNVPIIGVTSKDNNWDLTWLGKNAGYLSGSAFPTWSGNSVLTGHVTDASGAPGPFAYIKDLQIGDKIKIHFGGQVFIYEVRENRQVLPNAVSTVFQHENYNWLTLVTCEDYNIASKTYNYRRYARAALVSVIPEK